MWIRECKPEKGGKRIKLINGPGDGMILVIQGRAAALKYETKGRVFYYRFSGLTDGRHELFSFFGETP